MKDLEEKIFATCPKHCERPRIWKRFVDVVSVIHKEHQHLFLTHLNKQHPRISFTVEEEQDRSFPFMDVLSIRREDRQLERQVYQKKTYTNRYVQYNSHCPVKIQSGIIQRLVNRAMIVCSDISGRNEEIKHIKYVMQSNGYPRKFTEKAIRRQVKRGKIPKQKEIDDKKIADRTDSLHRRCQPKSLETGD